MTRAALPTSFETGALVRNLEGQAEGYRRLATLGQREFEGLLGGRSEDLSVLLAEQEATIQQLQELERERLTLLGPVAEAWQAPAAEIRLSALEPLVPTAGAARLRALRTELSDVVAALGELNGRNRRLLISAARILERWRGYMTASMLPSSIYSAKGDLTGPSGPRALDQAA